MKKNHFIKLLLTAITFAAISQVSLFSQYAHDYAVGPFLSLPTQFVINTTYHIKTKVTDAGTSNESNVPIAFYINNVLINTTNLSLNAGHADSVNNDWTTIIAGTYTLKYIANLSSDLNRANDTVQTTVHVLTSLPVMCWFTCLPPTIYTPITGNAGPSGDDVTMTVPLGFTFIYKGNTFTQASICTNGWVVLGSTTNTSYNNDLATTDPTLTNMIAGFWNDLNTNNGGNIQYITQGTAPNRIFICQFTNVAYSSGTGNVTFQIKIHEQTGEIEIIYGNTSITASSGSVGINVAPGGSGNFTSITPGSNGCSNTTYSTTVANNFVNFVPHNTWYSFCHPEGIKPNGNNVPKKFSLSQNYPNPFNPTTIIQFAIPKSGSVKLVVYDILGAEVAILINENIIVGVYNYTFDGENLASGVYFYKITTGNFNAVKKMLLVK